MRKIMFLLAFLSFIGMQVFAQTSITGMVTDANGEPVPGANIRAKGFSDVGTITDLNGSYTLSVPAEATTLIFSFVGMQTQEVAIGEQTTVSVTLQNEDVGIDEVVVTALGISREKKAIGYAVQNVSGDDLTQARETNVINSLSGKVAGIHITNSSGSVGSSSRIVLRGPTSITGNNEPLFVVDGVPIDNTNFSDAGSSGGADMPGGASVINPDDIESISVLKGANAAALYGSRAANGVILITTKKGKKGNGLGISVSSNLTFETPLKLADYQNSYGQGSSNSIFRFVDGQTGDGGTDESWGAPLGIGLQFTQFPTNGATPEPWVAVPDNVKNFFDLGMTHTNNIAIMGGNDKGNFRLSLTNMGQKGIVPNTDLNRITVNASAGAKLTDKFSANISVNYIKSHSNNRSYVGYDNENPVQQMIWSGRQVDFDKLRDYQSLPLAGDKTAAAGTPLNWNTVFQNNPYWVLNTNLNGFDNDRIIGNVRLRYDFTDWLAVRVKTGTDYSARTETERKAHGSSNAPFGSYEETYRNFYETNSELLIMFNKDLSDDISLSLNLGGNRMKNVYHRIYGFAPQLELKGVYNLSNAKSGVPVNLTNLNSENRINSVYLSGQLAYKHFLYLEFSARNDWSSVLPPEANSFFYPAVSLSADITEMAGIKNDILSFLKFRASYAIVGGATALPAYRTQQTFGFRTSPWGNVLLPFNPARLNSADIKPETTNSMEFGIDMAFLNNRINLDVTYYNTVSKDLIVPAQITAATGYTSAYKNIGEMTNNGIEIQLDADVFKSNNFVWNVGLNFAANKNELVSLGDLKTLVLGGQWNMTIEARKGYPYGTIFGPAFERAPSGEIVYVKGLPKISETSKVLGDIQPDWTGGVSTRVSYKGISLGALVDAKIGGEVHSMSTTWGRYAGILSETLTGRETGIIGKGVIKNEDGTYRTNDIVVTGEAFNKAAYTNDVVESAVFDASYIKLRQVTLGYTLPNKLLAKLPISDFQISLVGRNLALLYSKVPHIDPETAFSNANGEQGQEFGQLPSTRSFGFNINFKF